MVLDELTNPQVYTQAVQGATQPIPSQLVKNIAFEYAANMITTSLEDLSASGVPDVLLTTPDFKDEREAVKAQVKKAKAELEEKGQVSPETLANCRVAIKALHDQGRQRAAAGDARPGRGRQLLEGPVRTDQDAQVTLRGSVPGGIEQGLHRPPWGT